jgi:hypothetical protein
MAETYLGKRLVIVVGSLIVLYAVHALAGAVLPIAQAPVDAAGGYGIGILVHKYWS